MKTITKRDLAIELANRIGFSQRVSQEIVSAFFDELAILITDRKTVKFSRFGQFVCAQSPPRKLLHPKSGEIIHLSGRERVVFKPSRTLKAIVNGKREHKKILSHR